MTDPDPAVIKHDDSDSTKQTELFEACCQGDVNRARALLQHSHEVDVNGKYDSEKHGHVGGMSWSNGFTCLMFAVRFEQVDMARMLLYEFHANVDQQNEDGMRALHLAASYGLLAVVRLLRAEGKANLDVKDKDGETALMRAVCNDKLQVADYLLQQGAKANEMNNEGKTALTMAIGENMIKLLKKNGGT